MKTKRVHTLDRLHRVRRFLHENEGRVTGFGTHGALTTLDTAVADRNTHQERQPDNTAFGFEPFGDVMSHADARASVRSAPSVLQVLDRHRH